MLRNAGNRAQIDRPYFFVIVAACIERTSTTTTVGEWIIERACAQKPTDEQVPDYPAEPNDWNRSSPRVRCDSRIVRDYDEKS